MLWIFCTEYVLLRRAFFSSGCHKPTTPRMPPSNVQRLPTPISGTGTPLQRIKCYHANVRVHSTSSHLLDRPGLASVCRYRIHVAALVEAAHRPPKGKGNEGPPGRFWQFSARQGPELNRGVPSGSSNRTRPNTHPTRISLSLPNSWQFLSRSLVLLDPS